MKKISSLLILLLLISSILSFTAFAGDEENPEIEDNKGDADLSFLDIESAWFHEKEEEPQYLFTSIKFQALNSNIPSVLSIKWHYNNIKYIAGLTTSFIRPDEVRSGLYQRGSYWQWKQMPICQGILDYEKNIITWKIPKENIGNPKKGEILTKTQASAVLSFPFSFFDLLGNYRDFAPDNTQDYGQDYIIQYE
jgi:hypothetical protein